MAGPSMLQGLAGIQQGGEQQGPDMMQIVNALMQIKGQQKQQAVSDLQMTLEMGDKTGMFPDEKTFTKMTEAAGIPIESIQSIAEGQTMGGGAQGSKLPGGVKTQDITKTGKTLQTGGGTGDGGVLAKANPAGTGVVESSVAGAKKGKFTFDDMVSRVRERITTQQTTETQKAHLEQRVNGLKLAASDPNGTQESKSEALGGLIAMGEYTLDLQQLGFAAGTPEDKKGIIALARGMESPADKENRISVTASNLFNSGRYATYEDATRAAKLEPVKTLPDLKRMAEGASIFADLVQVTGSAKLAGEMSKQMENGANLSDVLPANVVPVVQQQLDELVRHNKEQEKQGAEQNRIAGEQVQATRDIAKANNIIEGYKLELEAEKFNLALREQDDKEFNGKFSNMVDMLRADQDVPAEMVENMVNELAVRTGMTPERVEGILGYLSFKPVGWVSETFLGRKAFNPKIGGGSAGKDQSNFQPQVGPKVEDKDIQWKPEGTISQGTTTALKSLGRTTVPIAAEADQKIWDATKDKR